uniref:Uncharacterized protein n=1 Tax=Klebsiella pneumoniae TaxID=573 RepID=A0A8B0SRF2_KLEPN|nr:hypothetical protein [Klebsiella pneumoniae]
MARIFSPPESIGSPLGCVGADRTPKRDGDLAVSGLCATRRSIFDKHSSHSDIQGHSCTH